MSGAVFFDPAAAPADEVRAPEHLSSIGELQPAGVPSDVRPSAVMQRMICEGCGFLFLVTAGAGDDKCFKCGGNLGSLAALENPTAPPTGGDWLWDARLGTHGRWRRFDRSNESIVENAALARIALAVEPHLQESDRGYTLDERVVRVIARLSGGPR